MTDPRRIGRKGRFSNPSGNCLVVGIDPTFTQDGAHLVSIVNDSAAPWRGTVVRATQAEWRAFIASVKAGEFDLDDHGLLPPPLLAQALTAEGFQA